MSQEKSTYISKPAGALIEEAKSAYASDNVEIDDPTGVEEIDEAKVSRGEDGAWVQAWVWVAD